MKALYKLFIVGLLVAMIATSCGGRKHDAAYYEQMVDSIRKAETLKDLQPKVAVNENPADAWFDTLGIHTLPIKTAGADLGRIGRFTDVPLTLNEYFGYPVSAKLKALALPKAWRRPVVMLAEMQDSITPVIYLYTMNKKHLPIDQLCIYERKPEDRRDDFGET